MIEEAALRREVALAVEQGDADGFETSTVQYIRRFANSVHMANFRRQLAVDVATRGLADDPARRSRLEAALGFLAASQRQDVYLSIAWEGLKGGGVDLVRWAAANAAQLASEDSAQHLRSRLCEAAALIVTDEFDKGLSVLESLPADRLKRGGDGSSRRGAARRQADPARGQAYRSRWRAAARRHRPGRCRIGEERNR